MTTISGNFTAMDLAKILARTEARITELGMTPSEVSVKATRSPDTIRNWQRRVAKGGPMGASSKSISAIADVLHVPVAWLMGDGPDSLTEYLGQDKQRADLLAIYDRLDPALKPVALRQIAALVSSSDDEPRQDDHKAAEQLKP
jgi:hypothetical protein